MGKMKNKWFVAFGVFLLMVIVSCDNGTTNDDNGNGSGKITVTFNNYEVEEYGGKSLSYYGKRVYYDLNWTSVPGASVYKVTAKKGSDPANYFVYEGSSLSTNDGSPGRHAENIDIKASNYTDPYICTYTVYTITSSGIVEGSIKVTYKITKDGFNNITRLDIFR